MRRTTLATIEERRMRRAATRTTRVRPGAERLTSTAPARTKRVVL